MMQKPEWLKKHEQKKFKPKHARCCQCVSYKGFYMGTTRHKNKETVETWKCKIHSDTINTKYSYCCDDFVLNEEDGII